jgi:hypothetical protein
MAGPMRTAQEGVLLTRLSAHTTVGVARAAPLTAALARYRQGGARPRAWRCRMSAPMSTGSLRVEPIHRVEGQAVAHAT